MSFFCENWRWGGLTFYIFSSPMIWRVTDSISRKENFSWHVYPSLCLKTPFSKARRKKGEKVIEVSDREPYNFSTSLGMLQRSLVFYSPLSRLVHGASGRNSIVKNWLALTRERYPVVLLSRWASGGKPCAVNFHKVDLAVTLVSPCMLILVVNETWY